MPYKIVLDSFGGITWFDFWQQTHLITNLAEEPIAPLTYLITLLGVLIMLFLVPVVNKIYSRFHQAFKSWCYERLRVIHIHTMELILPKPLIYSLVEVVKYIRSFIVFSLLLMSAFLLGNVFPGTRSFVLNFVEQIVIFITRIWEAIVAYLPDLVALFVIVLITYYLLKFMRFIA
ncbi:MAG: hypothetical protein ACK2T5_16750, partial [Anaerolineales bacterium]